MTSANEAGPTLDNVTIGDDVGNHTSLRVVRQEPAATKPSKTKKERFEKAAETPAADGDRPLWLRALLHWTRMLGLTYKGMPASLDEWANAQPASVRQLVRYIHSAAWVPGDSPLLEILGRGFGYLFAIPWSLACYALAWLGQRPARAFTVALFTTAVYFLH